MVRLITRDTSALIYEELLNVYQFSKEQLMELAGFGLATTIATLYPCLKSTQILILCGDGIKGGCGIVAARILKQFGFNNVTIALVDRPTPQCYWPLINAIGQAEVSGINVGFQSYMQEFQGLPWSSFGLIVDALFEDEYYNELDFKHFQILQVLLQGFRRGIPIVAIDHPSSWNSKSGPASFYEFMPDTLFSTVAPRACSVYFAGRFHYLAGRYVPGPLAVKYDLDLPVYPGVDCIVKLR